MISKCSDSGLFNPDTARLLVEHDPQPMKSSLEFSFLLADQARLETERQNATPKFSYQANKTRFASE